MKRSGAEALFLARRTRAFAGGQELAAALAQDSLAHSVRVTLQTAFYTISRDTTNLPIRRLGVRIWSK